MSASIPAIVIVDGEECPRLASLFGHLHRWSKLCLFQHVYVIDAVCIDDIVREHEDLHYSTIDDPHIFCSLRMLTKSQVKQLLYYHSQPLQLHTQLRRERSSQMAKQRWLYGKRLPSGICTTLLTDIQGYPEPPLSQNPIH